MKSFIFTLILFVQIWVWNSPLKAQTGTETLTLTLPQCVDMALKQNLQVRQGRLNTDLAQVDYKQSWGNFLPSVNGSISHNYNFGKTIDPFTNQFISDAILSQSFGLNSNLTLFNGLQNYHIHQQAKNNLAANQYNTKAIEQDVSLNVANAYLQVLFAQELVKNRNNQLQLTKLQQERTQKMVEAGRLAQLSVLDVQSQLASEELQLVNAQNQQDLAHLNLVLLLNLATTTKLQLVEPAVPTPEALMDKEGLNQLYQTAVKNQPEIKSAEYNLRANQNSLAVARGGRSPRLALIGNLNTFYSGADQVIGTTIDGTRIIGLTSQSLETVLAPNVVAQVGKIDWSTQVEDNLNKAIGLNLQIPIFNSLRVESNISKAKIAVMTAQVNLEQRSRDLNRKVQQAYADASAAYKKYLASKKALDALTESFNYANQRYDLGIISSLDITEAKNRVVQAESELLQAKYDYLFKLKVLDVYQGKPLTL